MLSRFEYARQYRLKYLKKLLDRYTGSVDKCWLWPNGLDKDGYGRVTYTINRQTYKVHRISAAIYLGFNENPNVLICHTCRKKNCYNPSHLYIGDYISNAHDKVRDGTNIEGEIHWNSILTEQDVKRIRELYKTGSYTYVQLASLFGVTKSAVNHVINSRSWKFDLGGS